VGDKHLKDSLREAVMGHHTGVKTGEGHLWGEKKKKSPETRCPAVASRFQTRRGNRAQLSIPLFFKERRRERSGR